MDYSWLQKHFFLLTILLGESIEAQQWMKLALASVDVYNQPICNNYKFWTKTQRNLCINYANLIPIIGNGASLAYHECRLQFRWHRWNCMANKKQFSLSNNDTHLQFFANTFSSGSREAAFVSALFSAGVVHTVTKACSSNRMSLCSCHYNTHVYNDKQKSDAIRLEQCSDNVEFGISTAKQFIDSVELSTTNAYSSYSQSLMNLHNNNVGRKAVKDGVRLVCRCHGLSGSCTTQICSREISSFRLIGNMLREKFKHAVQVKMNYVSTHHSLAPVDGKTLLTNNELIYLEHSPAYCEFVSGRRCKRKSSSSVIGSCNTMCCGRGHRVREKNVVKNCHCKFVWCCKVTCQKCKRKKKIFNCK